MNRRNWLGLALAAPTLGTWRQALAQRDWSSLDDHHPIYLEGKAVSVKWQDPVVELELRLPEVLKLPIDLDSRTVPAQVAPTDGKKLLSRAILPIRKDPKWRIELAPLRIMSAWNVPEISDGTTVGVIGYTFPEEKGEALLRAEVLFLNGKTYPMRSGPA